MTADDFEAEAYRQHRRRKRKCWARASVILFILLAISFRLAAAITDRIFR